jgi:hypothetical protein
MSENVLSTASLFMIVPFPKSIVNKRTGLIDKDFVTPEGGKKRFFLPLFLVIKIKEEILPEMGNLHYRRLRPRPT